MVKSMPRLIFAACHAALLASAATTVHAQPVPGRDLLEFPIGTVAEAPALAFLTGDGFWNPALVALPPGALLRAGIAALHTPSEQGVTSHLLSAAGALPDRTTIALSILRASVDDLVATDSDPQTLGDALSYSTIVASVTAARRQHRNLVVGAAFRFRNGELDGLNGSSFGVDGGILADGLTKQDARIGVSTFLWRPANAKDERTRYSAAGDVRVLGTGPTREARAGYSFAYTEALTREHYAFVNARHGGVEGRAGLARLSAYNHHDLRLRLGLGLHYAHYTVGLARDENGAGLSPTYQFTISAILRRQ